MAVLTVQDIAVAGGVAPTFDAAAAGGDEIPTGPGVFAVIKNDSAGSVTVTVRTPVADGAVVEYTPAVAAGAELWVALPQRSPALHSGQTVHRDADDNATIGYSAVTSVTVAAVRAP